MLFAIRTYYRTLLRRHARLVFVSVAALLGIALGIMRWNSRVSKSRSDQDDLFYPPGRPQTLILFPDHANEATTHFEIAKGCGYPVINVYAGDQGGHYLFDTGGQGSDYISEQFRIMIHAPLIANTTVQIDSMSFPAAVVPQLRVGDRTGIEVRDVASAVLPLDPGSKLCNLRIDGVFSASTFDSFEYDIDYQSKRIRFRLPSNAVRPPGSLEMPIPAITGDEHRPFTLLYLGSCTVPALLDTCNYDALTISDSWLRQAGVSLRNPHDSFGSSGSVAGAPLHTQRGAIEQMFLGPIKLRNISVQVYPDIDHSYRRAVIGAAVLCHYRMIFNHAKGTLLLVGPKEVSDAAPDRGTLETDENRIRQSIGTD